MLIEFPTDQIAAYSCEAMQAVREVAEKLDCSISEAIEIARIGAYNIRTEVIKHDLGTSLAEIGVSRE